MTNITMPEAPEIGNKECVEFLETLLERAHKGGITHVSFVFVDAPGEVFAGSYGSLDFLEEIHDALDDLLRRIDETLDAKIAPYDPAVPADQVSYNVGRGVLNFDFVAWLIAAEMRRVREGAPPPLKVAFYCDPRLRLNDNVQSRLENIHGPLSQMIGAISNDVPGGFSRFSNFYYPVTQAFLRGEPMPQFKPLPAAVAAVKQELNGSQPVVITLRETEHFPHRNSNIPAWLKFANYLKQQGEHVIFVRDTARATEPLDGQLIFPAASLQLHIRLALFLQAKINFGVANGPMTLCFHTDAPFRMFTELDPHHQKRYQPHWPEWWKPHMGIEAGEQFPWFKPTQRIVWKGDSYDSLVKAYEE